jgi:hypothetical protein
VRAEALNTALPESGYPQNIRDDNNMTKKITVWGEEKCRVFVGIKIEYLSQSPFFEEYV